MPQALPSFEELLASLELESQKSSYKEPHFAHYSNSPSFDLSSRSPPLSSGPSTSSSRSSSGAFSVPDLANASANYPSPSIVVSQSSPVNEFSPVDSKHRNALKRYNPYGSIYTRRGSLPGDLTSDTHLSGPENPSMLRSYSASPPIRRSSLGSVGSESASPPDSPIMVAVGQADQPISALARRRQPYSPRARSFEIPRPRKRSASPSILSPVSIPSLPPLPRISFGLETSPSHNGESGLPPIHRLEGTVHSTSR